MLTDAAKRKISSYLVLLIFFLYKSSESLLQPSIRIYIYQEVCLAEGLPAEVCNTQKPNAWSQSHQPPAVSVERQNDMQRTASNYLLAYRILLNLPAVFFCLFAGSWSDRVGRKYPMMLPPLGAVLAVFCFAVSTMPGTATLAWVMIGATIYGFFGKSTVMTMACTSYVADTSSREDRTELLGRLLAMNFFGIFFGSLLTGVFQSMGDIHTMLIVNVVVNLLLEVAIVVLVRESVDTADTANCAQLACPCVNTATWSLSVRDSIGFLMQKRPQQLSLIFLFASLCINQICKQGEQDVILLFVEHEPFKWPGEYYGYYLSVYYACMGLNLMLALPLLTRYLQPSDAALVAFGLLMKTVRLVITSLAETTWLLFASAVLGCFAGFIVSATKSMTSKLVDESETGQTFSLLSCAEALANLLGPAMFNPIYGATVDMFPGMVFSLDAGLHFFLMCCFLRLYLVQHQSDSVTETTPVLGCAQFSQQLDSPSSGLLRPQPPSIRIHSVRKRSAVAATDADEENDEVDCVSDADEGDRRSTMLDAVQHD